MTRLLRDVLPAVAVYVGIRLLGLVALLLLGHARGVDGLARLVTYDAPHLLGIAAHGYQPLVAYDAAGYQVPSNLAFFPLFPLAVRVTTVIPGVGITAAGFVVTALAGVAAAVGLDRLGRCVVVTPRMGAAAASAAALARRAGLILVALWACWPHSAVLAMPYTEALFVGLAVWSLIALLDGRWVTGGVLALLAGATRPVGIAVAVVIAAVTVIVRDVRHQRRPSLRPLAAAALAPLGFLAYWGWVWSRTGRPDAWLRIQADQWHSTFDGGRFTAQSVAAAVTRPGAIVLAVSAAVVVASVVLLVALVLEGAPLTVVVYHPGHVRRRRRRRLRQLQAALPAERLPAHGPPGESRRRRTDADPRRPDHRPGRAVRLVQRLRAGRLDVLALMRLARPAGGSVGWWTRRPSGALTTTWPATTTGTTRTDAPAHGARAVPSTRC